MTNPIDFVKEIKSGIIYPRPMHWACIGSCQQSDSKQLCAEMSTRRHTIATEGTKYRQQYPAAVLDDVFKGITNITLSPFSDASNGAVYCKRDAKYRPQMPHSRVLFIPADHYRATDYTAIDT